MRFGLVKDQEFCDALKRYSDRICNLIFHADIEWIDVEIQIDQMREFCRCHAPEKMNLFEMVYVSRFRRLWETWGRANEPYSWYEVEDEEI